MDSPCRRCSERYLGCHGQCDRYKEFKSDCDRVRTSIQKANAFKGYVRDSVRKTQRDKHNK